MELTFTPKNGNGEGLSLVDGLASDQAGTLTAVLSAICDVVFMNAVWSRQQFA